VSSDNNDWTVSIKNTPGKTGKNKGKILTIKCCWVVDCTCQGDSFSKEDGVILCLTHGSMYKRPGTRIEENDITIFDVIGQKDNDWNNEYNNICHLLYSIATPAHPRTPPI